MKTKIKKAPVKFQEDLLYFQHFMLIFVFAPKSVIITTLTVSTPTKQEVSLKKIIVEGYRAVGSLNTKMVAFSFRTFCCCSSSLLIFGQW